MKMNQTMEIKNVTDAEIRSELLRLWNGSKLTFCLERSKSGDNTKMYTVEKINPTMIKVLKVFRQDI